MLGPISGNSGFDRWFFGLELLAFMLILSVLIFGGHKIPAVAVGPILIVGGLMAVLAALIWWFLFPPRNGIEGAGRIMIGGPVLLVNVILLAVTIAKKASLPWF